LARNPVHVFVPRDAEKYIFAPLRWRSILNHPVANCVVAGSLREALITAILLIP
jgi:hypothetical protein